MTEEEELLAKIGHLAGQINQHKNQSHTAVGGGSSSAPYARHARGGWRPYRGRGRGASRAFAGPHRNRTLVMNNQSAPSDPASGTASPYASTDETTNAKTTAKSAWIAKTDRHMQLINSSIFDQETQARNKAIAETQMRKAHKRAEREKSMVLRHAQSLGTSGSEAQSSGKAYTILIGEIPFQVSQNGSKLISLSSDPSKANATPKRVKVGGVVFVRSKRGNLHRLGAVASKKYALPDYAITKRIDVYSVARLTHSIKEVGNGEEEKRTMQKIYFDGYHSLFPPTLPLLHQDWLGGTCFKGPSCPYTHDPNKVAICKDFLQAGNCDAGLACDLSHDPSPERSPACLHFLRGRCTNPSCRYTHTRVTPGALVCRDFANLGYCDKGATCKERHVHECPDYANTGNCGKKNCPLPHVDRAGQIRKFITNKAGNDPERESDEDISSDEDVFDEIDSDDVDSDDLEGLEEITQTAGGGDASQQLDFIGFS